MALAKEDSDRPRCETLFTEAERVTRSASRRPSSSAKRSPPAGLSQLMAEKDKRQSGSSPMSTSGTSRRPSRFPDSTTKSDLTRKVLPGISLAEVNGLASEWMPEGNRVVMVSAPQKARLKIPDEATLAAAIKAAASQATAAVRRHGDSKAAFFRATPTPGTVTKTNVRADVGITEWTLSNGVTVVLKPTTFKQDEVVFRAFSPGGTSLVARRRPDVGGERRAAHRRTAASVRSTASSSARC